jgi:proline dehydrogenase
MVGSIARIFSHALERRASTSYVIGPELSDAMRACRSLQAGGVATTICAWNSESDLAGDNAERCLEEIEAIARAGLDCYVSLKGQDIGFSRHLFSKICQTGRRLSVGIHLDSMGPEAAGEMFSLIEDLQGEDSKLGCTIPGRWTRSLADADRAIELGLRVRVVKGQWADPNQPGIDARAGFLRIVDRLAGQLRQAAIATHDPALARAALERLCASGTACELELLFGLPYQDTMAVAKAMRIPVRLYIPYGYAWLPYALRQVRKNPRIALWIMRDLLRGGSSEINRLLREQAL